MVEAVRQARTHGDKISILSNGQTHSYAALIRRSEEIASFLLNNRDDLKEARVAFMVSPGFNYVATLWGIWQAGGIAVPLCLSHPQSSLSYVLKDTACEWAIASAHQASILSPLCEAMRIRFTVLESVPHIVKATLPDIATDRRAMILYTSGTTNLPKGVVATHRNLNAQIATLVKAWRWSSSDQTLCVLPLHHVHGIVNVVSCSLWAGARCQFIDDFEPEQVFDILLQGRVNVFMAVPTIYFKLITAWEKSSAERQQRISDVLRKFRLMVSGSAALPVTVMDRWEAISGHKLLERYGMTELGMAISNPYDGPRKAGKVGIPLEGVFIRLCDERNVQVENEPGEIQVRGENVFLEYWGQPAATKEAFTPDGWFKTGDVAVVEDGYHRILGRNSVDIIKSGGYKISALEIEEVLRSHDAIKDCAVVGIEDEEWGEVVAAALVLKGEDLDLDSLRSWMKTRIPSYRVPRKLLMVDELPRNAMGKVTKNEVKKLF